MVQANRIESTLTPALRGTAAGASGPICFVYHARFVQLSPTGFKVGIHPYIKSDMKIMRYARKLCDTVADVTTYIKDVPAYRSILHHGWDQSLTQLPNPPPASQRDFIMLRMSEFDSDGNAKALVLQRKDFVPSSDTTGDDTEPPYDMTTATTLVDFSVLRRLRGDAYVPPRNTIPHGLQKSKD